MRADASIAVIAPTRGRPKRAVTMASSWDKTRESRFTSLTLVLDSEDTERGSYAGASMGKPWNTLLVASGTMIERTNDAARTMSPDIFGWAADDNVFVTHGWDEAVREAFCDPSIAVVNTNDLLVGDEKGGVYFVRGDVVKALGWLLPPFLEHLYADFAVTSLAKRAGAYKYLGDVIIEHRHPYAGKAEWDDNYRSVNNPSQDSRDGNAFRKWWAGPVENDVEVIRACLGV